MSLLVCLHCVFSPGIKYPVIACVVFALFVQCRGGSTGRRKENPTHGGPDSNHWLWTVILEGVAGHGWWSTLHGHDSRGRHPSSNIHSQTDCVAWVGGDMKSRLKSDVQKWAPLGCTVVSHLFSLRRVACVLFFAVFALVCVVLWWCWLRLVFRICVSSICGSRFGMLRF